MEEAFLEEFFLKLPKYIQQIVTNIFRLEANKVHLFKLLLNLRNIHKLFYTLNVSKLSHLLAICACFYIFCISGAITKTNEKSWDSVPITLEGGGVQRESRCPTPLNRFLSNSRLSLTGCLLKL